MKSNYKKVLYIDFDNLSYEFKIHRDLWEYVGGIGVSYRLLLDNWDDNVVILATGPLSGYFPYISKANLLYLSSGTLVDRFGGGTIAGLMNMVGVDAIVFKGQTDKHIHLSIYEQDVSFIVQPSKEVKYNEADFLLSQGEAFSNGYFSFGDVVTHPSPIEGVVTLNIETTLSRDFGDYYNYEALYKTFLDSYRDLTVEPRNNPSCLGCPMGCDKSSLGETENIAILPRCLISCAYAEDVYKNIPNVYAALNSVGYEYHHSHLEKLPELVGALKSQINEELEKNFAG